MINSIWLMNRLANDEFTCMRSVVVTCGLVTTWVMIEAVLEWMSIFGELGFPSTVPPPLHKFRLLLSSIAQICQLHVQMQLLMISICNCWLAALLLSRLTLLITIFLNWKRWCGMWRFLHTYMHIYISIYHAPICTEQSTIFSITCVRSTVAAKHCYYYCYYYCWLHVSCIPSTSGLIHAERIQIQG